MPSCSINTIAPSLGNAFSPSEALPSLDCGRLHEVLADPLQSGAATGVCLGMVHMAARRGPLVWLRQAACAAETGQTFAPGLLAFGLDPEHTTFVTLTKTIDVLRAGIDCARCTALGAVIIEPSGASGIDLAVTRRLVLAAAQSGVTLFLLREAAHALPTAAWTRWRVKAAPSHPPDPIGLAPSRFDLSLVRHRAGVPPRRWLVEWRHDPRIDRFCLTPSLCGPLVSVPGSRALAA